MPNRMPHPKRFLSLGAAVLALALAPAAAQASTVTSSGGTVTFTAASGVNTVTVAVSGGNYALSDSTATVTAGSGCSQAGANAVTCSTSGVSQIRLNLGDGDDRTTVTASQNVIVTGGTGDDQLNGGPQSDQLSGEDGNDTLSGGAGPDLMDGGAGHDAVSYAGRTTAVRVDLDGAWDDGESTFFSPELDNVMPTVEAATGGSAGDVFVGTAVANVFHGGDGDDTISGLGGDDTLEGEGANDTIDSGTGTDTIEGGAGDDGLTSRDSGTADQVGCGDGADALTADREDAHSGCETVDVPPAPPAAAPTVQPASAAAGDPSPAPLPFPSSPIVTPPTVVTIVERKLEVSARGAIPVKIVCGYEQARDCRGTIQIAAAAPRTKPGASRRSGPAKGNRVVLARGKFRVRRGKTRIASLKAPRSALKRAFGPKVRRVNATLTVSMKNSDGSTTQILKPVTISAKTP